MTPQKTTAAKKSAGRTTSARVPSFDADRQKIIDARKDSKPKQWRAYGRAWTVKAPNIMLAAQVIGGGEIADDEDEGSTVQRFTAYILAHVVKAERKEFTNTLIADEDLDIDVLVGMVQSLGKVVYGK